MALPISDSREESTFTLGEFPDMSLEKARAARVEARVIVKDGRNPAEERRKVKQAVRDEEKAAREKNKNTFEFIALEWID